MLWALKPNLSSTRVTTFDFNSQQDVAEILQVFLDELKGVSIAARSISNTLRTTLSCNTCLCSFVLEENLDILSLQVSTDIQTSLKQFLSPEILSSGNKWFCPSCKTLSESTRETCVMNSAPILAIQLCRFSNQGGQLVKDETLVSCTQSQVGQYLTVPITIEDKVSFINKYSLIATINHSSNLSRGHYWACIKDLHTPCWYLCNDKLVSNVEEGYLSNTPHTFSFTAKCNLFPEPSY